MRIIIILIIFGPFIAFTQQSYNVELKYHWDDTILMQGSYNEVWGFEVNGHQYAVIGSGISGLSAAHFLSKKYTVDLFEKDNHFGGHSYTVEVPATNEKNLISLDLGFIVFN